MRGPALAVWLLLIPGLPLRAQLTWTSTRVELTPASGDTVLTAAYPFENKSEKTVRILDIHSSCGCTVPELERKSYAPGEKGELKATFTIGSRQGLQTKLITVRTDAGDTVLQFVANLYQRLEITPRLVIIRGPDNTPRPVKLAFRADGPVTHVTLSEPGPAFRLKLTEDKPGSDYTLVVTPAEGAVSESRATVIVHSKGASGIDYTDSLFLRRTP
ncbi:hypothetical protein OPIT5_20800 [Opitutaceae bacterium TAV5]|nr:hypothetical protein OPIT5_20800 [Opitutaceae bacterium TAV5]